MGSEGNVLHPTTCSLPLRSIVPPSCYGACSAMPTSASSNRVLVPQALELAGGSGLLNVAIGPVLQCLEAASLGMPFEVWKTRMGRYRTEGTLESLRAVYTRGGGGLAGVAAFWAGLAPKLVESASKGAILMVAKEGFLSAMEGGAIHPGLQGALAGAGGGACQVTIMGPCTYLVTGAVTGDKSESTMHRIRRTYAASGIRGFYPGGTAIAFRQMTNWASRQGFTEAVRNQAKLAFHGDRDAKLTKTQEVACGIVGGALACWNHPFEVARIEQQSRGDQGQRTGSMVGVLREIVRENGVAGVFKGIVPRVFLGIWQTLFMVTGAKLVKDLLLEDGT